MLDIENVRNGPSVLLRYMEIGQITKAGLLHMMGNSSRDLVEQAEVMAISSAVDELRANGFEVQCERRGRYWYYRLIQPVQLELVAVA